uniref:Uncharacterized protein n=1 Tax=Arundo donax TaxID=35708 RepID=A0A0A9H317_ARUDO
MKEMPLDERRIFVSVFFLLKMFMDSN